MADNLIFSTSIATKLLREALRILTPYKLSVMRKGIFIFLVFFIKNTAYSQDSFILPSWVSHPQQNEFIGASIPFDNKEIAETSAEFSALLSHIISLKREETSVDIDRNDFQKTRNYNLFSSQNTPVGKMEMTYIDGSESNYNVQFSIGIDYSVVRKETTKDGTCWVSIKPTLNDGRDSIIGDFTYHYHTGNNTSIYSEFNIKFKGNLIIYENTWKNSSSEKEIIAFGFMNDKDINSFKEINWNINTYNRFTKEGLYVDCPIVKDYGSSYCKGLIDFISQNMNNDFKGLRNVNNSIVNGRSIVLKYEEHPSELDSKLSFTAQPTPTPQKRIALVLGNGDYKVGHLENPVNDANDICFKLENLGFETNFLGNGQKRETEVKISKFCEEAKQYDLALFYYAGHAIQDQGVNYLIPVDVTIDAPGDIKYRCIELPWILRRMNDSGVKAKIIILDACRDNPVAHSWERGVTKEGLSKVRDAPEGTILLFSALPGKIAQDGIGKRNSPFTEVLLKLLDIPMLPVHDLCHKVQNMVAEETNKAQIPALEDYLPGDFYLNTNQGK